MASGGVEGIFEWAREPELAGEIVGVGMGGSYDGDVVFFGIAVGGDGDRDGGLAVDEVGPKLA